MPAQSRPFFDVRGSLALPEVGEGVRLTAGLLRRILLILPPEYGGPLHGGI
jgi:hypothetical protein